MCRRKKKKAVHARISDLLYKLKTATLTAGVCQIKDFLPGVRVIEAM